MFHAKAQRECELDKAAVVSAGGLGATGVAIGAFGAHGLPGYLEGAGFDAAAVAERLDTFVTGTRYQLYAALAVLAIGLGGGPGRFRWAVRLLVSGAVVFCGLLYVLALVEGLRWLGAVVPIGGLAMIAGWVALAVEAASHGAEGPKPESPTGPDLRGELVRLEEVITHQQQTVESLNEALTATRDELDGARRRSHSLEQAVQRLVDMQQAADDLPDEKPPHY